MHERQAEAAVRGIARNGRDVQIVAKPAPDATSAYSQFDPDVGVGSAAPVLTTAKALQTGAGAVEDDGVIPAHDRVYLFDATVTITNEDRIRDEAIDWPIVKVQGIKPGERLILQRVYVKQ